MKSRFGGKFGKKHCTLTEAGAVIADIAHKCVHITRVIHGVITLSRGSSSGSRHVKIRRDGYALKVSVTAGSSNQVMYVYAKDLDAATTYIAERARKEDFLVTV